MEVVDVVVSPPAAAAMKNGEGGGDSAAVESSQSGSMTVFRYDKSLLTRLYECKDVLKATEKAVPASKVREQWMYFVEMQIEPAGWQAFWRIPRVICESLEISYPTVVFGMVEQVHFSELKATFSVTGVQDDDVHLPGRHEVELIDLLPTKFQENEAINIETTAACVDMLRYFYKHVWMPWDNDNDEEHDWADKHLKSRIQFNFDVMKSINRSLAAHIRALLQEARDIQERRDYLETDLSEDEDLDQTNHKSEITDLMRLHLRMANIRSEIEILENSEMREIYQEMRRSGVDDGDSNATENQDSTFLVTRTVSVDEQLRRLEQLRSVLADVKQPVRMRSSLQQCLDACLPHSHIYLPPGKHEIKFIDHFVGNGTLSALTKPEAMVVDGSDGLPSAVAAIPETIISSVEDDCWLLTFDGNTMVEGIIFDCRKVRMGIQIRRGSVLFLNCTFLGDASSNTKTGLIVNADARLWLTKCVVQDFSTGIECCRGAQLSLQETQVLRCGIAIDLLSSHFELSFRNSSICNSKRHAISIAREVEKSTSVAVDKSKESQKKYDSISDISSQFSISGECNFTDNHISNVIVFDGNASNRWLVESDQQPDNELFAVPAPMHNVSQSSSELELNEDILVSDSDSELSSSVIVLE